MVGVAAHGFEHVTKPRVGLNETGYTGYARVKMGIAIGYAIPTLFQV
jgi:hypothetical protein